MADGKCEVCKINPPIGVASTAIPLSVAYCAECARRNAQPEGVFEYWFDDDIKPQDLRQPSILTFANGSYISYRKWYKARLAILNKE
jgi:hypothetical protein